MISDRKTYDSLTDEALVKLSSEGDSFATEQLLNRYKNTVRSKARMYFLAGADRDDIVQEGMIGLFKAIRDFNLEKAASFKSFPSFALKDKS